MFLANNTDLDHILLCLYCAIFIFLWTNENFVMIYHLVFGQIFEDLTSLVAQLVRNPSAMQKTPVGFLGCEDSLEKG